MIGHVAGNASEGCVQASEQVVNVGFLRWFEIMISHCSFNTGMVVRGVSVREHWHLPFDVVTRGGSGETGRIEIQESIEKCVGGVPKCSASTQGSSNGDLASCRFLQAHLCFVTRKEKITMA